MVRWRPRETARNFGRPQMRWLDDIKIIARSRWYHIAQDRTEWKTLKGGVRSGVDKIRLGGGRRRIFCQLNYYTFKYEVPNVGFSQHMHNSVTEEA